MPKCFKIVQVGSVEKTADGPLIRMEPAYAEAMDGLEGYSHLAVFYWFHENDTPALRGVLQVHPRRNPNNPLTGVFATHAPLRPNLIALTYCQVIRIDGLVIHVDEIDARDGSPVIDIKPYIPIDKLNNAVIRLPKWV